jgi:hypothetical protein
MGKGVVTYRWLVLVLVGAPGARLRNTVIPRDARSLPEEALESLEGCLEVDGVVLESERDGFDLGLLGVQRRALVVVGFCIAFPELL